MKNKAVGLTLLAVLGGLVLILGVGLAYERGHNLGYDEGWNDDTAYAESWGWRGCIEENNLYERYYENR